MTNCADYQWEANGMFDIGKSRSKGMDERTIKILQDINENNQKVFLSTPYPNLRKKEK